LKFRPVGAELFCADGRTEGQTDGQTDRQTDRQTDVWKLIVAFRGVTNVAKHGFGCGHFEISCQTQV